MREGRKTLSHISMLDSFIGQSKLKHLLKTFIFDVKNTGNIKGHILLAGSPGKGKTTLASLIAKELHFPLISILGNNLKKPIDLSSLFIQRKPFVIFIDEIHRISPKIEEILYPILDTYSYTTSTGKSFGLQKFVCIGATTRLADLQKPFRDRFFICETLEDYSVDDMSKIIRQHLKGTSLEELDNIKIREIVHISKNTPRIALNAIKKIDLYIKYHKKDIHTISIPSILKNLGIYAEGLTSLDVTYLKTLRDKHSSVALIASVIGEDKKTVLSIIEPYLYEKGFIEYSTRGRKLTPKGLHYLCTEANM